MKPGYAAALALVGWYIMVVPATTNAQASPTSTPSTKTAHVPLWHLCVTPGKNIPKNCRKCVVSLEDEAHSCEKEFKTRAECESGAAEYMQDWVADADKKGDEIILAPTADCWEVTQLEAQQRAEAAIAANAWVLKVPHVKYVTPDFFFDEKAHPPAPFWGIGVSVDKSENVREVEGKVPAQLDGVRVRVDKAPVAVWCLSVLEGLAVPKHSGPVIFDNEAHSCEKEFKTKTQCVFGAARYVQDFNVAADRNGDVVVEAPKVDCWENRHEISVEHQLHVEKRDCASVVLNLL